MPKYLLRRRNVWGQFVHLDTLPYDPGDYAIEQQYGPGEYSILVAQEGIVGLQKLRDVSIQWKVDYVAWSSTKPTLDEIREKYGVGNYFVLSNCQSTPFQVFPEGQPHDMSWKHLQEGASVMRNVWVIFRVNMPWL
ncbi:MAG: hypothetical protein M1368_02190 [Thaumarchaeota archaeon]|nr:hypothetical protein [Nitrososphaerota archaeon]